MPTVINGNASIVTTTWLGNGPDQQALIVSSRFAVTNAASLGSAQLTIAWTDPVVGARSVTQTILLTTLGGTKEMLFPTWQEGFTDITYAVTLVGVLGSPSFNIVLAYSSAA